MGLFRRKSSRIPSAPLPTWDDTRWRSHLRANALGTEHHIGIYSQMITDDRKEAARLHQNSEIPRARTFAESAIRNQRTVTALSALNPLSNALYQRSDPLAGFTSLVQIPEPARSGIVTLIFAAARLHMSYLTDTVNFLKEQFGPMHVEQIQEADGELYPLVNPTVRDALSPAPATPEDVDKELASAVKQHFGIDLLPSSKPTAPSTSTPSPSDPTQTTVPVSVPDAATPAPPPISDPRRTQTTPLSAASSDLGAPLSPQLSAERSRTAPLPVNPATQPSEHSQYSSPPATASTNATTPISAAPYTKQTASAYPLGASEHPSTVYPLGMPEPLSSNVDTAALLDDDDASATRDPYAAAQEALAMPTRAPILEPIDTEADTTPGLGTRSINGLRNQPTHIRRFDDGDEALILRYEHLREVIAA